MDLFDHANETAKDLGKPLAERLRPRTLREVLGQQKTLGAGSIFSVLIQENQIPNLILWGPPGTGKTSFALALAHQVKGEFVAINAVDSGARELRALGESGRDRRRLYQTKTILFVDEIHRFNKGQQDVLLPFIEKGDLILVGATTENPSYELNKALLSRCRVLVFERLADQDLQQLLRRAAQEMSVPLDQVLSSELQARLISTSDGDARRLLNSFEILAQYYQKIRRPLSDSEFEQALNFALPYDKKSEFHYDVISAFIKSVRGSDPDASVYYLVRMLEGGEDPVFIARRLIILASEDVGNADPRALTIAVSGLQAVEAIGLPEAAITLSQVTTYLACCPKSNLSYMALQKARDLVQRTRSLPVPLKLRSSRTSMAKDMGFGKDYQYPHDFPKAWVDQCYLPDEIKSEKIYEPSSRGFEKNISEYLRWVKSRPEPKDS